MKLSPPAHSFRVFGVVLTLSVVSSGQLRATDQPVSHPSPAPVQDALIPDLPVLTTAPSEPLLPLQLFSAQPFGPNDKGGTFTDMGAGQPAVLTAREEALLALGRAAVEASRAAGTLEVKRRETGTPPAGVESSVDVERKKQDSLRNSPASTPVLGSGSPADFAIEGGSTVQIPTGPIELHAREVDKLAAAQGQPGIVILAPPAIVEGGSPTPMTGNAGIDPGAHGSPVGDSPEDKKDVQRVEPWAEEK